MKSASHQISATARALLLGGAAVLALSAPSIAFAQQEEEAKAAAPAEANDTADGNEIIVTATKREQTLQDVPVAVTVTTAEAIERAQIRDIRDLSSLVPSLRVNQLQSSANTNFYIRGFGNGANNAGIEPSVGLFVDGVYRARSASMIGDLPDVQRVEVLRGPQSTLFGKNASAGVISIVTKAPKFEFGGNLEASYGNYNAFVLKGYLTGPLGDNVAASVAAGYNQRDGYVTDLNTGSKVNGRNRWFVRGQILFEPSSDIKVRLIGDYSNINEVCCAVVNLRRSSYSAALLAPNVGGKLNDPATPFADVVYNNFDSTNRIENGGLSGEIDWSMGVLKLTSITSWRRTNSFTNQDSDFSSADLLGKNAQDLHNDTFTQELRLNSDWGGPVNFLLGAFYYNDKVDQTNALQFGTGFRNYADNLISAKSGGQFTVAKVEQVLGALQGNPALYTGGNRFFNALQGLAEAYKLKDESFSIFGQADYKITDRLTLTGGINYTHDAKTFSTNVLSADVFSGIQLSNFVTPATNLFIAQGVATILNTAVPGTVPSGIASATQIGQVASGTFGAAAQTAYNNTVVPTATANGLALLSLRALQFMPPFLNLPNAVESGKVKDSNWSYTARLAFDLNDDVNLYASFATGYKAASVNLSRDSRPTAADLTTINTNAAYTALRLSNLSAGSRYAGPENSTVYEAGLKAKFGGMGTVNIAVFKQSIKGFQSNLFTGTGFFLANAGKQSSFGIEFEGTIKPVAGLTLSLSATYLDPKYDSFVASGVGNLTGTRPGGVTQFATVLGADWAHEFSNGHRLIVHADYRHENTFKLVEGLPGLVLKNDLSGTFASCGYPAASTCTASAADVAPAIAAANDFKQKIDNVDGSITYALDNGFEVTAWVRNLLDKRTILQIFDSPAQTGSISGYPSEPRTFGGSLRFKW